MKQTKMTHPGHERGVALVTVLMLISMLSAMLATYFILTRYELSMTRATMNSTRGFYAAEAGLNLRARAILETFRGYNRPIGVSPAITSGQMPCVTGDQGVGDYACGSEDFRGRAVQTYVTEDSGNPASIVVPPGELYANLNGQQYSYRIHSVAHHDPDRPEAILAMDLNSVLVPLFQFAAFYNKDLEILPGPDMTLAGPVHVNGDLYLGAGSSLTITGQVTTTGDLYHGRKEQPLPTDQCSAGTAFIHDAAASPVALPACGSPTPGRTLVSDMTPWGGTVRDHVAPLTVPPPEVIDPVPGEVYWDSADIRIIYEVATGEIELRQADNTLHPANLTLNTCGTTVGFSNTFRNHREAQDIEMLEVDMVQLLDCVQANSAVMDGKPLNEVSEGGIVLYLGVEGLLSNTVNPYGVRVKNAETLASTDAMAPEIRGLTVVTNQALYVQGDYNATNKKPAAFLADSLNVLSNAWDDADDSLPLSDPGRLASATTVNAAFLAGTDTTGDSDGTAGQDNLDYNGGLENYPRFHEDWSGIPLTYRGSFVSLNEPRHVDGPWDTSGVYVPPIRDWGYDTDFNDAANLPPLSPRFVYIKQNMFYRDFEL